MKFGTDIMPEVTTPNTYFNLPTLIVTVVTDAEIREVEWLL
jgi:hypothetical protein